MRTGVLVVVIVSLAVLPGCRMNERLSGTVFGGVGGLAIGGATAGLTGALIGGVLGAVGGYLVGDYIADRRECGRCQVFDENDCGQVGGIKVEAEHVKRARDAYERGRAASTADEARRWYLESYRLHASPAPLNMLALGAVFAGESDQAERYLLEALELDPDYELARRNLDRLRRNELRK